MVKLVNRAKMTTSTEGTGTITLGDAVPSYQTFSSAGVANDDTVRYVIEDGLEWEIGTGVFNSNTLTRNVTESSNGGNPIALSGGAQVFITATSDDLGIGGATFYETTIPSSAWSSNVATVTVTGIKADDRPYVSLDFSRINPNDYVFKSEEFNNIYKVEASADDTLKFYSLLIPTSNLEVLVRVG